MTHKYKLSYLQYTISKSRPNQSNKNTSLEFDISILKKSIFIYNARMMAKKKIMLEYVSAKLKGEEDCYGLNRKMPRLFNILIIM